MNGLSVIIPSKTASNLAPCVQAILMHEPNVRVIVVDDGVEVTPELHSLLADSRVKMLAGAKPFNFSANINAGIEAAGSDDIVAANDDTILETPGGFRAMQRCSEAHPTFGVISAATNNVGNVHQHLHPGGGLRRERRCVCFVCVLIPRATIDKVGLLDKSFIHYGLQDDAYCLETLRSGLELGIFDGCFVDHSKLKSSYRGEPGAGGDFRPNLRIFIEKYGVDNWLQTKETSSFPECFPS